MKNNVVDCYEHYQEEDRLNTNNARRIEFLTTVRIMEALLSPASRILDCAAGTGAYAFHLADQGHDVTATDITPRHIRLIDETLKEKPYAMRTAVLDATDLSMFADESFDAVLNMGPFYHLLSQEGRDRCMAECLRVLKKGGLIFTAYIPRYYICQLMALTDAKYVNPSFLQQILRTGVMRSDDPLCFWTDAYFASAEEMEQEYQKRNVSVIDHFAQDGLSPMLRATVDAWPEDTFRLWCEHHDRVCRERTLLGMSNHVMIVGRKE